MRANIFGGEKGTVICCSRCRGAQWRGGEPMGCSNSGSRKKQHDGKIETVVRLPAVPETRARRAAIGRWGPAWSPRAGVPWVVVGGAINGQPVGGPRIMLLAGKGRFPRRLQPLFRFATVYAWGRKEKERNTQNGK